MRLAKALRVVAGCDGAMVSTAEGCFWLGRASSSRLIAEVLPVAAGDATWRLHDTDLESLVDAGVLDSSGLDAAPTVGDYDPAPHIHVIRETALSSRVLHMLEAEGASASTTMQPSDFVFADLSGLCDTRVLEVVAAINAAGCRSLCVWKRADEIFLGPLVMPGHSACWHCARLRLADSLAGAVGDVDDDPLMAEALATNILLACRYPAIAGFGCVLTMGEGSVLHSILPVAYCATCGGSTDPEHWAPVNHSSYIPQRLRSLADPRAGIIRSLYLFEGDGYDAPSLPICASARMAPLAGRGTAPVLIQGEGKGVSQEDAVLSAIGEGVERYAGCIWREEDLIGKRLSEIEGRAFDPRWLVLYAAEQYTRPGFAFREFGPDTPLYWIRGHWTDTHEEVLVPAQATYLNFTGDAFPLAQSTSNGLAAGESLSGATLRAVYELVERDAFMIYWLTGRPARRIDEASCDDLCQMAIKSVRRLGASVEMYILDYGLGIPTVVCIGMGDGVKWPGVTIGLGTHTDPDIACRKAILEHGHYGPYMRRLMKEGRHEKLDGPADVLGSLDHGLFYCRAKTIAALSKLRGMGPQITVDALKAEYRDESTLDTCIARLAAAGIRVAAVDLTPADLTSRGLTVVRAFGTYLQPIHFGNGYERRANPRLQALATGGINEYPHPIA